MFFSQYWIELAGTVFAIIYLILSIRENIWLWPMGFLTSFFYLLVFFSSQLYADMSLQFYYLVISVYGWYYWKGNKKQSHTLKSILPTISISYSQWIWFALIIIGLTFVFFKALLVLPNLVGLPPSDMPLADAFTTAASVVATWMLAKKMLENWIIWIVVDVTSLIMYIHKELYITVFLFFVYTVMAVVGYFTWRKNMAPVINR